LNLKQVGAVGQIYVSDNDDHFMLESWMDSTMSYSRNSGIYDCPLNGAEPKLYGYAMNLGVLGLDVQTLEEPNKTFSHFDTDAINRNVVANLAAISYSRHNNSCMVVRMDSSAKRVPDPSLPAKP
jgi:hypothetical protein